MCDDALIRRVNELYHDFQSTEFNDVHRLRHQAEQEFWMKDVLPLLAENSEQVFGIDLCSGTGFVPLTILPRLSGKTHLMCLDISRRALDETSRHLGDLAKRVTFVVGDVSQIPVADATQNWVTMNAALHHLPNPERVLQEVDRILKPGGYFCMGHEPNKRFFHSRVLPSIEKVIWRCFWYLSPRQNLRRIRNRLGVQFQSYEKKEHLEEINQRLLEDGMVEQTLTRTELRKIVDVHAHTEGDDEGETGFYAEELIETMFRNYTVCRLIFSDYGGDMLRKPLILRHSFDAVMRLFAPRSGRLFSLIVRKPSSAEN